MNVPIVTLLLLYFFSGIWLMADLSTAANLTLVAILFLAVLKIDYILRMKDENGKQF
jgi:hypothetical protein